MELTGSPELIRFEPTERLVLPNCPGCNHELSVDTFALGEEGVCPQCGVVVLLVNIDGVTMFLRDGWT